MANDSAERRKVRSNPLSREVLTRTKPICPLRARQALAWRH